jgi:4-hydroxy-3-methylbut-2-en-1-yl diphosphate reductase
MAMEIILAKPRGFCAGVDRAVDTVELALEIYGPPVYVKHEIVHNTHVVNRLKEKGVEFIEEISEVPIGSVLIFSAHGVPPQTRKLAQDRKLKIIDATCPLVTRVHLEAIRYSKEGYSILLIGHRGHVEVAGTMGEAPEATQLIHDISDARNVKVANPEKVVALSQTTLSITDVDEILTVLQQRFPKITLPPKSDICYATTNRQAAVKKLVKEVQVVLIVGSKESSNANRLREVAIAAGAKAYLVNDAEEILSSWFEGISRIGITSGASTPEDVVQSIVLKIESLGATTIRTLESLNEEVWFGLPNEILQKAKEKHIDHGIIKKHSIQTNSRMRVSSK